MSKATQPVHASAAKATPEATAGGAAAPPERQYRVVVADDHEILRMGVCAYCRQVPWLEVVGEAANGAELLKLVQEISPDLVITDLVMPTMSGREAIRHIRAIRPDLPIVVFSFHNETDYVIEVMREGANAYLCKDCIGEELALATREVLAGRPYVSSRVAGVVAQWLAGEQQGVKSGRECTHPVLSSREQTVLRLLIEEKPSKEIACELGIAVSTVDVHRHNLMLKVGVSSVVGLIKYAIRRGMATPPPA